MKFHIENRPVFTSLRIEFEAGESFKSEKGAMIAMSPSIELKAKTSGKGFMGTVKAMVGGESLFASVYTATAPGELILAPPTSGDVLHIDMTGNTILTQAGAYLAGSIELDISTQGSLMGMVTGEGMFLSKISGNGKLFLASYGAIIQKELAANESFKVDSGHIVAFEGSVQYKMRKAAKGLFSTAASGEWLVVEYTGPGKIWYQTRNLGAFANVISKFLPKQN